MSGGGRLAALLGALSTAAILTVPAAAGAHGSAAHGETPTQLRQEHPTTRPHSADAGDSAADAQVGDETESEGGVVLVRYAGSDPYELSLAVARALVDAGGGTSEWVVLASGESWADAATAGPLAASLGAPLVLVPPGGLQSPIALPDLVEFLRSTDVRRALIVGSPDALPNHEPSVLFGLGMLPRNIERIHRPDPAGNSVAVAERIGAPAELGELGRTVIVASDQSVADAAAAGPLAAAGPFPLLLTAPDELDPRITAYLIEHDVEHAVLVGGIAATAPAVREAIETTGVAVTRLAGEDRYHTAALVMELLAEAPRCAGDAIGSIGLALANEPDLALAAGRLLGTQCIPLLFTDADRLAQTTQNYLYLHRHRTGIEPNWHLIGNAVTIVPAAIDHPPVRMVTVADNADGEGQHIVVLDEHHQARRYLLEERFSWITQVGWSSNYEVIEFWGNRDDASQAYVLDPRSAVLRHRPQRVRVEPWYSSLVRDDWVDAGPTSDRNLVLYRASTEHHAGHSIFVYDVESGSSRMLTRNGTDDTHHVLRWWQPLDRSRYFYFRQAIDEREDECDGVPSSEVGIINIHEGTAHKLSIDGYVINEELHLSPERTHVVLAAYPTYALAPAVNLFDFWYWGCTYYGKGDPSLFVYDISGNQPVQVSELPIKGHTPKWSPDNRRLVFRAPTDGCTGHSLFTLDLAAGSVVQATENTSDEYHHVLNHWLPDRDRFIFAVQRIDELESSCYGLVPEQQRRSGVPVAAFVTDLGRRTSTRIPFDGFAAYIDAGRMIDALPGGNYIDLRADGHHVVIQTYPGYYPDELQGNCGWNFEWPPTGFYAYDLRGDTPKAVPVDELSSVHAFWSPDRGHVAYSVAQLADRAARSDFLILNAETSTTWPIDPSSIFGPDAQLSFMAWSPNSKQILFRVTFSGDSSALETRAIADVEHSALSALNLTEEVDSELEFRGFSPDGSQVIHQDHGRYTTRREDYSPSAGLLYINSIDPSGALVHTYDLFAASAPAEPVYSIFADKFGDTEQGFTLRASWTPNGIYAAGYYYLDRYWDF